MAVVRGGRCRISGPFPALVIATLFIGIAPTPTTGLRAQPPQPPLVGSDRPTVTPARPPQINQSNDGEGDKAPAPITPPPRRKDISRQGHSWLLIGGGVAGGGLIVGLLIVVIRAQPQRKHGGKKVTVREDQVDNYRLVNLLVTGLNSQVWEAAEMVSGRHFALKVLLPEHARSPAQRQFLFHEAEVGKKLVHPKIIKILHVVKDPDHPYLLMDFFPSASLKTRLTRKEPFIREHFREIVEQTATALAFMHSKGWVHRDVKPDHILVNAGADVRLIDFALAQPIAKRKKGALGRQKKGGKAMGTRSYMSPEQIRGEALDARADVYSVGATLFELLTGRPPFRAASPEDLLTKQVVEPPPSPETYNPEIHRDMAELIVRMLAKDPDGRPRDFPDFLMKFRKARIFKAVAQKKSS
jgi:serine/threonine protein kinase